MTFFRCLFLLLFTFLCTCVSAQVDLRAPAYPLVTHNPNFSIWSMGDELNAAPTEHWTGSDHDLLGLVNIDGETYRFLGVPPVTFETILPASDGRTHEVAYTETDPGAGWTTTAYDDASWRRGGTPFTADTLQAGTHWTTDDLWYRRTFDLESTDLDDLMLRLNYDDEVVAHLNGVEIFRKNGWTPSFRNYPISEEAIKTLRPTGNVLAIHVRNNGGGQWLDAGLVQRRTLDNSEPIADARQTDVRLSANQTRYTFDCAGTTVTATFTSPLLIDDLQLYARPVTYLDVSVTPREGKTPEVALYLGASGRIATDTDQQEVASTRGTVGDLSYLRVGTSDQSVLQKRGDDVRIDWGYFYVSADGRTSRQYVSDVDGAWSAFLTADELPATAELTRKGADLMLNTVTDLGKVSGTTGRTFLLGYDEVEAINYFGQSLKPWHDKESADFPTILEHAARDHAAVIDRVVAFDDQLYTDAERAGGKKYADLCALAYRQAIAAHTLVESPDGDLLYLSKENNSNGSINTVDVTYPSAPLFLLYNPDLLKGMLNGIFHYSESGRWPKPFPAHDLGTYPVATGQTYGEDMPVEEAGNMLILTAAIAAREGNADYAKKHWPTLTSWAKYLRESGFDPANQLSTDDFAGHLARNANLSIKAIIGLACYGKLALMLGDAATAEDYAGTARTMATKWVDLARDGDHYALAFGQPDTWSQKYNLVWDEILGLDVFPAAVARAEIDSYITRQRKYGLPLDSRKTYTKSDWVIWTATLAESRGDFEALTNPIWKFADETPDRVPLTDWHETKDARRIYFKARSVVGGYLIKLLQTEMMGR